MSASVGFETAPPGRARLTRAGRWLLITAAVCWGAGFLGDRNPFLVVAAVMAPLVLISYPLSHVALRRIALRVRAPRRVVTGQAFRLSVDVERPGGIWSAAVVRIMPNVVRGYPLVLVRGAGGERVRLAGKFRIDRRGVHVVDRVQVSTLFPFGLVRRSAFAPAYARIIVHPAPARLVGRLPLPPARAVTGMAWETNRIGEDELFGLREYRPGDRLRHIAWRASARQNQLVVKEMRADAEAETSIVLHAPRKLSRTSANLMERAVACTVAAIKAERRAGRTVRLDVRGASPAVVLIDRQPWSYVRALDLLARYGPGGGRVSKTEPKRRRPARFHIVPGVARSAEIEPDDTLIDVANPAIRDVVVWGARR